MIGLCLATALIVSAASPIPSHPPAASITATKAIEAATKFAAVETKAERYCSSVTLVEGGMTPAPHGSARHWIVTFQDAGSNREELRHIYVNMEGIASDVVLPMSKYKKCEQDETQQPLSAALFTCFSLVPTSTL